MKVFVVMRELRMACGACSEPYLAFSTREAAEAACHDRTVELKALQSWRITQSGQDIGKSAAELLGAFGIDGVLYYAVEMEMKDADLLRPSESRIVLS